MALRGSSKTTRAFRTIGEASEELGLQPHVLRFWESKFSDIQPMKRGGGRRFYRPEDIEFIRGIKVLLHVENHPIKDVQKLIKREGAGRILELGRSIERAAQERPVKEVALVPERIVRPADTEVDASEQLSAEPPVAAPAPAPTPVPAPAPRPADPPPPAPSYMPPAAASPAPVSAPVSAPADRAALEGVLQRISALEARWQAVLDEVSEPTAAQNGTGD